MTLKRRSQHTIWTEPTCTSRPSYTKRYWSRGESSASVSRPTSRGEGGGNKTGRARVWLRPEAATLASLLDKGPVWAREHCRISPPRFLAECCKRQLNQGSFVLLYFRLFTFSDLYWVCLSVFPVLFCLSVSVKWLAVKTASGMTYTVSSGALNSTPTKPILSPLSTFVLARSLEKRRIRRNRIFRLLKFFVWRILITKIDERTMSV